MAADLAALNDQGDALDQHRNGPGRVSGGRASGLRLRIRRRIPCIREPSRARRPVSKERQRSPAGYLRKTGDADMLDRRPGDLYDRYLKPSPCEIEQAAQARHRSAGRGRWQRPPLRYQPLHCRSGISGSAGPGQKEGRIEVPRSFRTGIQ
jgi:hypothetical protein